MKKYLINEPNLSDIEKKYVLDVIDSTWLSAGGKHTTIFEKKFSEYLGTKHSIAVQSGTAALHVALKAFGVGKNDCVILHNLMSRLILLIANGNDILLNNINII